jgi:hypothetical protein
VPLRNDRGALELHLFTWKSIQDGGLVQGTTDALARGFRWSGDTTTIVHAIEFVNAIAQTYLSNVRTARCNIHVCDVPGTSITVTMDDWKRLLIYAGPYHCPGQCRQRRRWHQFKLPTSSKFLCC